MSGKILTTLSVILLLIFSTGCSTNSVKEEKLSRGAKQTLAQSIESYILSNECGIIKSDESTCFAGILTKSNSDHNKCAENSCE